MSRWWIFAALVVIWVIRVPFGGGSPLFGLGFLYGGGAALFGHWLFDKVGRL